MTAYAVELRTGKVKWAAVMCILVAAGHLFSSTGWQGSWSETVQACTNSYCLGLVVVVAAAAWDMRRDLSPSSIFFASHSDRPPMAVVGCRWAAAATWTLGGYLLVVITGGSATLVRTPAIHVPFLQLAVAASGILAYMTMGLALGRLLPTMIAVPLGLLLPYVLTIVLAADPDRPLALFTPLDDGILSVGYALRFAPAIGQVVCSISATLLIVTVVAHSLNATHRLLSMRAVSGLMTLLGIFILSCVGLVSSAGGRVYATNATGPRTCSSDGQVCLWQDHQYLLSASHSTVQRMFAGGNWPKRPSGFLEHGLRRKPGAASIDFGSNTPDSYSVASAIADGAISYGLCSTSNPAVTEGLLERQEWLTQRALPGGQTVPVNFDAVTRMLKAPVPAQWSWFEDFTC